MAAMGRFTGGMPRSEFEAMNSSPFSFGAVVLAAGRSSRMGQPKLLLPWGTTSIIGHLLDQWQKQGARQIAVVCAEEDTAIKTELDRLEFPIAQRITNPTPERGMFSSIQCAAGWQGWQSILTHWAIVLGDQPHLQFKTLQTIIDFSAANPDKVCQPRKDGHRYHPVVLPLEAFKQMANTEAANLKDFLVTCETAYCEMTDAGLELDIDRPEDYQKAQRLAKL
jgi:molybdenum cofactor cytidylyltransferase